MCRRGRGRQSRQSGQCPLGLGGAQGGSVLNLGGASGQVPPLHGTPPPHPLLQVSRLCSASPDASRRAAWKQRPPFTP